MTKRVIDSCYAHDEDEPYRTDEEGEMEGKGKGIERGMVIEMSPHLGCEELDGRIDGGGEREEDDEQCGIERRYVVDEHDACAAPRDEAQSVGYEDGAYRDEGPEEVYVGEEEDELGDGVVGHDMWQE